MSDLFAANVPEEDTRRVLHAMRKAPHHTYQSLTKAPRRLLKFVDDFPPNLWIGVSSPPDWFMGSRLNRGQQEKFLRGSLETLAEVRQRTGNIVWMSAEPVSWDLTSVLGDDHPLDWIVIGAASSGRKYFQPAAEDIEKLLALMDRTRTPVFYKGNIKALVKGANLGRWREDFPGVYRSGSPIPAVQRRQTLCRLHNWTESLKYVPTALRKT